MFVTEKHTRKSQIFEMGVCLVVKVYNYIVKHKTNTSQLFLLNCNEIKWRLSPMTPDSHIFELRFTKPAIKSQYNLIRNSLLKH